MLDWITLLIEAVGLIILCIWVVLPIHEFKAIFHRLKQEREAEVKSANSRSQEDA